MADPGFHVGRGENAKMRSEKQRKKIAQKFEIWGKKSQKKCENIRNY